MNDETLHEVAKVLDTFRKYDLKGQGSLDHAALYDVLHILDPKLSKDSFESLVQAIGASSEGRVDISKFVQWVLLAEIGSGSPLADGFGDDVGDSCSPREQFVRRRSVELMAAAGIAATPIAVASGDGDVVAQRVVTHGPLIGEVTHEAATIWARGAGPGKALLQWWPCKSVSDEPDAASRHSSVMEFSSKARDFTAKLRIRGLQAGTRYCFRVGDRTGSFKTPLASKSRGGMTPGSALSFVFGSCIGGQGFGPEEETGFSKGIFESMLALAPDFIQINGDAIYADNAIEAVSTCPFNKGARHRGGVDQPAATELEGFRARYRYHLEDPVYARFLASTPVFNTWDDHEITDDWGAQRLVNSGQEQLLRDGAQAFFEYWPVVGPKEEPNRIYRTARWGPHAELFILDCRSYRGLHKAEKEGETPQMKTILGATQHRWLLEALSASSATWKFICTSVPLCFPTGWPRPQDTGYDGWSDGNTDCVGGPEVELKSILQHISDTAIRNVVFISGDVHFPFAISYDPFDQGHPLVYEFGATPFCALCLPPPENGGDRSLNPTVLFTKGHFAADLMNFGHITVDDEAVLNFWIRDCKGQSLYHLELRPTPPASESGPI